MNLSQWLDYQQSIHPKSIELGLERVREVAGRMRLGKPAKRVVTVAGTNGKGSTVAFVEAIARAAGYRVGAYTSPHLLAYNERVRIDGSPVDDAALVQAFEAVEAARGDTALTYFEFGTLAALWLFSREPLDLAVLEVGLGGRLDAVNLVDADVAIVTAIALDHVEYLGPDRESIAREKAGVLRPGKPAVIGELDPPDTLLREAERLGAPLFRAGRNHRWEVRTDGWTFHDDRGALPLPLPGLRAPAQVANASAAITALRVMLPALKVDDAHIAAGVASVALPGRMQVIPGPVEIVLDVAHNPQAAGVLAENLGNMGFHPETWAVFGMLEDKDVEGVVALMKNRVDHWLLAALRAPRGLGAEALAGRMRAAGIEGDIRCHASPMEAYVAAQQGAQEGDRIVVFGSFLTVADVLAAIKAARH